MSFPDLNNAFSLRVHNDDVNNLFEHVRSDDCHIAAIAKAVSATLNTSVSVTAFARNWLTYDKGVLTKKRAWTDFYESSPSTHDEESSIAVMFQNLRD